MSIGIAYPIAGFEGRTPFSLRPYLLTEEGHDRFWDKVNENAASGKYSASMFHRLFGEPENRDVRLMDFDTIHAITASDNPDLLTYYKRTRRRFEQFVKDHPDHGIDFYVGAIQCRSMRSLVERWSIEGISEWGRRVSHQLAWVIPYMRDRRNFRLIFDHSTEIEDGSFEWDSLLRPLIEQWGDQIVIEALPRPNDTHLHGLPAWVNNRGWRNITRNHPELLTNPGILGDVTRMSWKEDDGSLNLPGYVRDCDTLGHRCFITDAHLDQSGLTVEQVIDQAGEPLGRD